MPNSRSPYLFIFIPSIIEDWYPHFFSTLQNNVQDGEKEGVLPMMQTISSDKSWQWPNYYLKNLLHVLLRV